MIPGTKFAIELTGARMKKDEFGFWLSEITIKLLNGKKKTYLQNITFKAKSG